MVGADNAPRFRASPLSWRTGWVRHGSSGTSESACGLVKPYRPMPCWSAAGTIVVGSCRFQLARQVISRVCLPIIGFTASTRSMSPPSFISQSISWYIRELTTCGCVGLWLDNQMMQAGFASLAAL